MTRYKKRTRHELTPIKTSKTLYNTLDLVILDTTQRHDTNTNLTPAKK